MAQVDILLATYNGERFITSQLHSLLMQTFSDIRILVHDDGSSDETMKIIRNFARHDARIVIIDDSQKFGSPTENFLHLLSFATAPWIMFCDQDDIWFDNKVELMLTEALKVPQGTPAVVYCEALYWHPTRGIVGKGGAYMAPRSLPALLGQKAGVLGCSSMFNRQLKDIMLRYKGKIAMHDHLLELAAFSFGEVRYVSVPLILYRQHDRNVTGNTDLLLSPTERIKRKIYHSRPVMDAKHLNATSDFLNFFRDELSDDQIELLESYLKMSRHNKLRNILTALRIGLARDNSKLKFILKLIISPYLDRENRNNLNH